jgi:hypothetical protein
VAGQETGGSRQSLLPQPSAIARNLQRRPSERNYGYSAVRSSSARLPKPRRQAVRFS